MNANARSVFLGSKYAIAQMLRQEPHSSGDRGWHINMASIAGLVGVPRTRKYGPCNTVLAETLIPVILQQYTPHLKVLSYK